MDNKTVYSALMLAGAMPSVDYQLMHGALITRDYRGMRFIATAVACFSLLFILSTG